MNQPRIRVALTISIALLFAGTLPTYAEQAHSHEHPPQGVPGQAEAPPGAGAPPAAPPSKEPPSHKPLPPPGQGHQHGQGQQGGAAMTMKCPMMPMMQHGAGGPAAPSGQGMSYMMQGMGMMMQGMGLVMQGMGMMQANPAPGHHHHSR
jgi:hypothetical protein